MMMPKMTSFFTENKIKDIISPKHNSNSTTKTIKYLALKRKRSPSKLNDIIKSTVKINKKMKLNLLSSEKKSEKKDAIKSTISPIPFKFQNFSKNVFSVIFSYLKIDDLLKLINTGSRNIRLYIQELFQLMKDNGRFSLKETKLRINPFMNIYDSMLSKKYFLKNGFINDENIIKEKSDLKIKYILYHEPTNKNYYIVHHIFLYYFCYSDIYNGNETKKEKKNWKNNILFTLPDKEYYEKFQFLDENNNSEVAFFSMYKIFLYNISNKKKDNIIYLCSSCDFILYKKELKLVIAPTFKNEIEFFKVYSNKAHLKKAIYTLKIDEKIEYINILDFKDYMSNDIYNYYICIYGHHGKKIILFDTMLRKIYQKISSESNIINVNINNNNLIVYSEDKNINYYSIKNKEYSFTNKFNLNNLFKIEKIKYLYLLDSKYLNNMLLLLVETLNKKIKPDLFYLEYNSDYNNFNYSFIPLNNYFKDIIYDEELISISLNNEKINNENALNIKMIACHLNKNSGDNDTKNPKNNIISKNKNDFFIKEYIVNA